MTRRLAACAVCQVRRTTSPTRPMACESEPIMEIAPRSWSRSSAAIVEARMRDSANARSSGIADERWWQTMSMSRCSSTVLTVCGRVGFVESGSTWGFPATVMMSGAPCPPPAPSVWYAWIDRPAIASRVESTYPASLSVSVCSATCTPVSSATRRAASIAAGVAPVLVDLEPGRARVDLLVQGLLADGVALAEQGEVQRGRVQRLEHPREPPRTRCHRRRLAALRGAGAAGDHRRDPGADRLGELLRADEVDVAVDPARGEDQPVAGEDLRRRADHEVRRDAVHRVRVAGLAQPDDAPVPDADVGLHDAPVVEDERSGDHEVRRALGAGGPRLAHRLADHLAAAEHRLVAAGRAAAAVLLDADRQVGVREPEPVARRRAEQLGVGLAAHRPAAPRGPARPARR